MQAVKENMKAVIAFLTALGTWGTTALADGDVTSVEAFGLIGPVVAGLTVFAATNAPSADQLRALARWKEG